MEAVKGTTKNVIVDRVTTCTTCKGSGLQHGKTKQQCSVCHGSGVQTISMGGFHMQTTCSACGGAGSAIPPGAGCHTCDSVGKVREHKTVKVNIPAGVDQNSRVRVPGEGDAPIKGQGPNGDLFVTLNVSVHVHVCIHSGTECFSSRSNHLLFSVDKTMTSLLMPRFLSTKLCLVVVYAFLLSMVM